jgi:hypothetical protein
LKAFVSRKQLELPCVVTCVKALKLRACSLQSEKGEELPCLAIIFTFSMGIVSSWIGKVSTCRT